MTDKKFEIRFDKHGNIVVDNPELQRRLKYLLETNGELVMRWRSPDPRAILVEPRLLSCPPDDRPLPNKICPNGMCECGGIRVIQETMFDQQWNALGDESLGR